MGWSGFLDGHCLDASFDAMASSLPAFVDGDHDQGESGKGFQTKCPHMKGSMVGACAMAFLKCGLEWFP